MKYFKYKGGKLSLPLFFPDATRGFIKSLDTRDIEETGTPGILVNTFHLWMGLNYKILSFFDGIAGFMGWNSALISDSGGFQVMSLIKKGVLLGKISDEGMVIYPSKKIRLVFSPEESIRFQMSLNTDLIVALDDFTNPNSNYSEAKISVERTIDWALRSKKEFEKIRKRKKNTYSKPYIVGVVQGGEFYELREYCTKELVKIGFDGLGWGGWPFNKGVLNFRSAEIIASNSPSDYFLWGLGIGKPENILRCFSLGYRIFDCVLPTRDARHGRLYIDDDEFYSFYNAKLKKHELDKNPVSKNCDCLLCRTYSRAYLYHVFKVGDPSAFRLATIHNLRFYSTFMRKLKDPEYFQRLKKRLGY